MNTCGYIVVIYTIYIYFILLLPVISNDIVNDPVDQKYNIFGIQGNTNSDSNVINKLNKQTNLLINLAVFTDYHMYQYWNKKYGDKTEEYITNFVNTILDNINIIYHQPSLRHQIHIKMVKLEIQQTQPVDLFAQDDAELYKSDFCRWQKPLQLQNKVKWDHAILLTGINIRLSNDNSVSGLSTRYGMCDPNFSCTIVEGFNFVSVNTIAHEIGHSLGMGHDGIDNDCDNTFIMSFSTGEGKTTWSPCSKQAIDIFIRLNRSCVHNIFEPFTLANSSELPGQRFDANKQCKMNFGSHVRVNSEKLEQSCSMLHCIDENLNYAAHPALEGTFCHLGKWCQNGRCISWNGFGPQLLDGGWTDWSLFSECQGKCFDKSKGIKMASRLCTNPLPQNGGKYCSGMTKNYQLCELECSSQRINIQDFADSECRLKKQLNPNFTGQGLQILSDRTGGCQVWCYRTVTDYSSFGVTFPDGTACSNEEDRMNSYCIEGMCMKFNEQGFIINERSAIEDIKVPDIWSEWQKQGSCASSCLGVTFGLQLYKKTCKTKNLEIVKCLEEESYYEMCDATDLCQTKKKQSKEEFAKEICQKNKNHDVFLSGESFLFNYDQSLPQRTCKIFCFTKHMSIRNFGQIFPDGTPCSSSVNAVCIKGICTVIDHENKFTV